MLNHLVAQERTQRIRRTADQLGPFLLQVIAKLRLKTILYILTIDVQCTCYLIASGFTGDPTAPVIGSAGATNRNS